MKVILNESQLKSVFSKFLEKSKINVQLSYYGTNLTSIGLVYRGLVKLSQGDTPIGFPNGHIFSFYKVDNELILVNTIPDISKIGGIFKGFPPELLVDYFSGLIKDYIYKKES